MPTITSRVRNAWDAFFNKDPTPHNYGLGSSLRPDRPRLRYGNERSIVTSVYNRLAIDSSLMSVRHVKVDGNERYKKNVDSALNQALVLDANTDQTGKTLLKDIVMSMFDEGCVAVVPVVTDVKPYPNGSFKIYELRVGRIVQWYPEHVRVEVYNENSGKKEEIAVLKRTTAIIENPFYPVMNEPNSTLKRLIRKLNLLDVVDEQTGSGKLDLIIQLPYVVKTENRKREAERRRQDIATQLSTSKYGIAYTDATERITQLNRSVENNLLTQVDKLTSMLYSQLGLTEEILNGTADSKVMQNYYSRTIAPILTAITEEFTRKFLTQTARTQGHRIMYFNDPFKLVPADTLPDIVDKLTRNEIMSSNEVRAILGLKPSDDPKADELRNKNLNQQAGEGEEELTDMDYENLAGIEWE